MINELNFDSIEPMDAVQDSFTVLIWRTQWVKAKRLHQDFNGCYELALLLGQCG